MGPVFIMAYREKTLRAAQTGWVLVGIQIGNIADIIPFPLHPEAEGMFPEQELAGTVREGIIPRGKPVVVGRIGTIKPDFVTHARMPLILSQVVKRTPCGPTVV